jgi:hypothetical protein
MNAPAPPSDERAFTSAATMAYEEEALAWVSYDLNRILSHEHKKALMLRPLPENNADDQGNSPSPKSSLAFAPLVVRNRD